MQSPSGDNGAGTSNVQPNAPLNKVSSIVNALLISVSFYKSCLHEDDIYGLLFLYIKPTGTTFKGGRFVKKSYKKMNKSVPDPQSEYAREREKIKKSQQSAAPPPNPAANTRFARPVC